MLYICILFVVIAYVYLIVKHKQYLKYFPKSKQSVIFLYDRIRDGNRYDNLYLLYIKLFLALFIVFIMGISIRLNGRAIIILLIIAFSLIPFVIIYNMSYQKHYRDFNNLEVYLSQFILVFKSHAKVIYTLENIVDGLEGNVKLVVNESIKAFDDGVEVEKALSLITDAYPHFIVHNLHALVCNIENYGSVDYDEALDLIQDDIDDWSEDTNTYIYLKKNIIKKVNILIIFAHVICLIALQMLFSVTLETSTRLYQSTMFLFIFIEILTYALTQSILKDSFIQKSERL